MKWPAKGIWPLLGVTVTGIVIAYPPPEGQGEIADAAKATPHSPEPLSGQPAVREQPQVGHVELERLKPQKEDTQDGKTVANAFTSTTWYAPPPRKRPLPPSPPPPAPTAPPLPFVYMGRYDDPPKLFVIFSNGGRLYTVSQGDVIDGVYRVDRIADGRVDFVYLPLNITQSLSIGKTPENRQ